MIACMAMVVMIKFMVKLEMIGFMAAMVMGFQVASLQLLKGMEPGTKVRFSINTDNKKIVAMEPLLD